MARKKSSERSPDEGGQRQVRLDEQFARRATAVAELLGMSLGQYIQLRLDPVIEEDMPEAMRKAGLKWEDD